ncbi:tetratricopeptide repeat protein [Cellvibrio sp.]|uniref:tetratricopeptide repeat protein n=1 Tax=Cellvibrio sp. TaxID=1965322 RepID=UPI0039648B60
MDSHLQEKAEHLLENGDVEELYQLIEPYINARDPYALFLYSSFSLESLNESDDEFEKRSVELLKAASEGGLAEASYRLGVLYLYSDLPENEDAQSSVYFERAIAQGHSHSKFTYGFNLYYSVSQTKQDKNRGLRLMKDAADEGVALAAEELKIIYGGAN